MGHWFESSPRSHFLISQRLITSPIFFGDTKRAYGISENLTLNWGIIDKFSFFQMNHAMAYPTIVFPEIAGAVSVILDPAFR